MASTEPAIDMLFSVPDLPKLVFSWLDSSSLALAAWVCTKWRDTAREVRGEGKRFQLVLADLVPCTTVLAWAAENIMKLPPKLRCELCEMAASKGALATLQWARNNGCDWGNNTCTWAAENGHLEVLQWARKNDCPWNAWTCANAALGGHLELLQWAREQGCPWSEWTCTYAAEGGHLDVLQWARMNGCPWKKFACWLAAKGHNHATVEAWIEGQPD